MPIQTNYGHEYTKGLQGMPYDLTPKLDVTADAAVATEFGYGLVLDGTRTPLNNRVPVKLPDAANNVFAGIAVYDRVQQINSGTPAGLGDLTTTEGTQYPANEPIRLRRQGRLYVYSEQAVKPGDAVFLRHTANGAGTAAGQFRKDIDTDKAIAIANATWISTTSAAGLAVLEINLP